MIKQYIFMLGLLISQWSMALSTRDVTLLNMSFDNEDLVNQIVGSCLGAGGSFDSKKNIVSHDEKKCFDITCTLPKSIEKMASCLDNLGKEKIKERLEKRIKDNSFVMELLKSSDQYVKQCPHPDDSMKIVPADVKNNKNCYAYVCLSYDKEMRVLATVCNKSGVFKTEEVKLGPIEHDRPFECEYEDDQHQAIICPNGNRYILERKKKIVDELRDSAKKLNTSGSSTNNNNDGLGEGR